VLPSPYRLPPKIPRARRETLVEKVVLLVGWTALMTMLYLVLDPRHAPDYAPVRAELVAPAPRLAEPEPASEVMPAVFHPLDVRSISGAGSSRVPRRGPGPTANCR
jgi:hypothetical protein